MLYEVITVLVDVPGLNQVEREYDHMVMEEAQRAHEIDFATRWLDWFDEHRNNFV